MGGGSGPGLKAVNAEKFQRGSAGSIARKRRANRSSDRGSRGGCRDRIELAARKLSRPAVSVLRAADSSSECRLPRTEAFEQSCSRHAFSRPTPRRRREPPQKTREAASVRSIEVRPPLTGDETSTPIMDQRTFADKECTKLRVLRRLPQRVAAQLNRVETQCYPSAVFLSLSESARSTLRVLPPSFDPRVSEKYVKWRFSAGFRSK